MAHNIFGDRFLGRREPAWHGLGQVFDEPMTAAQAIARSGLDYRVEAFPLTANAYGVEISTGHVSIVRQATADDPQPRQLGVTTDKFQIIQNTEIAEVLDAVGLTAYWPVETAGALGYGERIFLSLAAGETEIGSEQVKEYFLVTEGKAGAQALQIVWTPVRVVCQNTLTTGLGAATTSATVPHMGGVKDLLAFYANIMGLMKESREQSLARMRSLVVSITDEQVDKIIAAAYPSPKRGGAAAMLEAIRGEDKMTLLSDTDQGRLVGAGVLHDRKSNRATVLQEAAKGQYERICDESPAIAGTGWAAWQAVTETADWREGLKNIERVEESALFGKRADEKIRAFAAASRICSN